MHLIETILLLIFAQIVFSESTIRQVHTIFRHGARTPTSSNSYPNDPYANYSWYPHGPGQLTNKGKLAEYNLGQILRLKYDQLLGQIYHPDLIYARSTSYDRTKQSLQLTLSGLWPPAVVQEWGPIQWQPISYEYVPYDTDKLLGFMIWSCPAVGEDYDKVSKIPVSQFLANHSELVSYVSEKSGLNVSSTIDLMEMYMGFLGVQSENLTVPEWALKVMDFFEKASKFEYAVQTSSDIVVRENGGIVIKKFLDDIQAGIDSKKFQPKIFLYAVHEYNMAYVLSALGIFDPHIPYYSSCLIVELHEIDAQYKLKVLYREGSEEFSVVKIPGCEELCELEKFKKLTEYLIPKVPLCP